MAEGIYMQRGKVFALETEENEIAATVDLFKRL